MTSVGIDGRPVMTHGWRRRSGAFVASMALVLVASVGNGGIAMAQNKSPDTPVSSRDRTGPAAARLTEGIAGRVTSAKGAAVEGLMVEVAADGPRSGPIPDIAIMTGADGRFEWRLSAGNYRVRILRDSGWSKAKSVRVAAGRVSEITFDDGDW
jgi:hypothetical protein